MGSEPIQVEGETLKHLDREVRDMISALTHRISELQRTTNNVSKSGSSQPRAVDEDDDEVKPQVITLAGSNTGATMRTGGREEISDQPLSLPWGEEEEMSTYVNSNFQAINNSLVFGGSYNSNDPGVHMDINDYSDLQEHHHHHEGHKKPKKKKPEKKEKKDKKEKKEKKEKKNASGSSVSQEDHSD